MSRPVQQTEWRSEALASAIDNGRHDKNQASASLPLTSLQNLERTMETGCPVLFVYIGSVVVEVASRSFVQHDS